MPQHVLSETLAQLKPTQLARVASAEMLWHRALFHHLVTPTVWQERVVVVVVVAGGGGIFRVIRWPVDRYNTHSNL